MTEVQAPVRLDGRGRTVDSDLVARQVGYAIAAWRVHLGISQEELAAALAVHRSAVSRWESANRIPTIIHLLALGDVLRCGCGPLLPGPDYRLPATIVEESAHVPSD